jgi:adiponectin receptor
MPKKIKLKPTSIETTHNHKRASSAPRIQKKDSYVGTFADAPNYLQDNEHIAEGYRIGYNSPTKILKTLFMIHNETVNIWTHLIGTIIVFFFIFEGIAYGMEETHILGKVIIK